MVLVVWCLSDRWFPSVYDDLGSIAIAKSSCLGQKSGLIENTSQKQGCKSYSPYFTCIAGRKTCLKKKKKRNNNNKTPESHPDIRDYVQRNFCSQCAKNVNMHLAYNDSSMLNCRKRGIGGLGSVFKICLCSIFSKNKRNIIRRP